MPPCLWLALTGLCSSRFLVLFCSNKLASLSLYSVGFLLNSFLQEAKNPPGLSPSSGVCLHQASLPGQSCQWRGSAERGPWAHWRRSDTCCGLQSAKGFPLGCGGKLLQFIIGQESHSLLTSTLVSVPFQGMHFILYLAIITTTPLVSLFEKNQRTFIMHELRKIRHTPKINKMHLFFPAYKLWQHFNLCREHRVPTFEWKKD